MAYVSARFRGVRGWEWHPWVGGAEGFEAPRWLSQPSCQTGHPARHTPTCDPPASCPGKEGLRPISHPHGGASPSGRVTCVAKEGPSLRLGCVAFSRFLLSPGSPLSCREPQIAPPAPSGDKQDLLGFRGDIVSLCWSSLERLCPGEGRAPPV